MPIDFPLTPASGQTYTYNTNSWVYNGTYWNAFYNKPILSGQISNNTVYSGNIASGQIGQFHLSSGSVTSGAIASGQVHQFALSSGSVTSGAISSGVLGNNHFGIEIPNTFAKTNNFRVSVTSGVVAPTTDQTAQSTLYLNPFNGDTIALYDGTNWKAVTSSGTAVSLTVTGLTSGKNYDIYCYQNGSIPALEFSTAWTSDTARADAIQYVNGVPLKSGTLTRRFVATVRTMSPTTVEDSQNRRFVWNFDNQVQRPYYKTTGIVSHTYTTASWRNWNNDATQRVEIVLGVNLGVDLAFGCAGSVGFTSQGAQWDGTGAGVGYDSVDISAGRAGRNYCSRGTFIGYHYCQMVEYGVTGGTYIEARLEGILPC